LPQFSDLRIPQPEDVTVMFQGFGGMAANAAHFLGQVIHGARLIGISDTGGFLYDENGLPAEDLFDLWRKGKPVVREYYRRRLANATGGSKFSNAPDDLLRESAFCLIPASPAIHYIDTVPGPGVSMSVGQMGRWTVIIEAANIYSPDPAHQAARARLERAVYRQRGVLIAPDYLVNSGSVIFAAQEHRIKTPAHLRIPETMLGDRSAVEAWLSEHAAELQSLAEQRRQAADKARADVIRRNMREMVELLASDADLLPCEAAEQLSIRRIATRESDRTAADIMESIITIPVTETIHEAAKVLVEAGSPILAVVSNKDELLGVVTDWDITRASALNLPDKTTLDKIMTRHVITAAPTDSVLELVRKLEYHEISAMPVVSNGAVLGMINTDMLSRRTLLRLLQSQVV
jgi:glutamate dehydrogenase (NAD(P)+)